MSAPRFMAVVAALSFSFFGCSPDSPGPEIATPPSFVTNGTLDGGGHPAVVLIIMDVAGEPAFRCSGTLIAPKVVLTAGHCAGERGEFSGMRIFTESDVQNGNNNYPFPGPNTIEAASWKSHPLYTGNAFFLHDVGVIVLKKGVELPAAAYGRLPSANQLDALSPSNDTRFTSVGYGLQRINPVFVEAQRVRMYAEPHLVQINTGFTGTFSLLLSNNASTGGTCFGDSGGPNYLGSSNIVAGVTSFGINGNCAGTGGVFRMDRQDVLNFVNAYLR
jgi:secreted trypsin-like serine protease